MSQSRTFVKGALLLSVAGLVTKILSMFFRVPLFYLTGDAGIGNYQNFYPIFMSMTSIAMVGIPQSMSKIVSERVLSGRSEEASQFFKVALYVMFIFSVVVMGILYLGAPWIIQVAQLPDDVTYVIYSLSFSTLFICISGVIKGYFQGLQIMGPTAISQVIEGATKVLIGVGLTYLLLKIGYSSTLAISGAAIGTSIGYVLSCVYLIIRWKKSTASKLIVKVPYQVWKKILFQLLWLAIPITIGATTYSYMQTVDNFTLFHRLELMGFSSEETSIINGQLGRAFNVINVPLTLSMALMISTIPAISEAREKKDKKLLSDAITTTIRWSILLAFPTSIGLGLLSKPIIQLIFGDSSGYEYLRLYSVALVFLIIGQAIASILQGLNKQFIPIWSILFSILVKIVINYILIPTELLAKGALVGSIVYFFIFMSINLVALLKLHPLEAKVSQLVLKPLFSALMMGIVVYITYHLLGGGSIATLLSIVLGALSYLVLLLFTRSFTREDVLMLTKGEKIIAGLKKLKLL